MSIKGEVERIKKNVADAYDAVLEKGGSVPEAANSGNLAAAIQAIPSGGGGGIVQWEDINGRPNLSSAASMIIRQVTLAADGWGAELVQTVPVPGVSADENKQLIIPIPKQADRDRYDTSGIICMSQDDNFLTFRAGSVPESDLNVNVYIHSQLNPAPISTYEWWSPKMTSSSEPEPYVVSADSSSNFADYLAFDGDRSTFWSSGNGETHWVQIDMGKGSKNIAIAGIRLVSANTSAYERAPAVFSVQGSDDEYSWTDIYKEDGTGYVPEPGLVRDYYFNESHYRYYRVYITNWYDKDNEKTVISEIEFYRSGGDAQ